MGTPEGKPSGEDGRGRLGSAPVDLLHFRFSDFLSFAFVTMKFGNAAQPTSGRSMPALENGSDLGRKVSTGGIKVAPGEARPRGRTGARATDPGEEPLSSAGRRHGGRPPA